MGSGNGTVSSASEGVGDVAISDDGGYDEATFNDSGATFTDDDPDVAVTP
jgi:hypothetical protein